MKIINLTIRDIVSPVPQVVHFPAGTRQGQVSSAGSGLINATLLYDETITGSMSCKVWVNNQTSQIQGGLLLGVIPNLGGPHVVSSDCFN